MGDFQDLAKQKKEKRNAIAKAIAPMKKKQPGERYYQIPMTYRLEIAEAAYQQLDKDDAFWCRFYRVMGYHFAGAGDKKGAKAARLKALALAEKELRASPGSVEVRAQVAGLKERVGDVAKAAGNAERARSLFEECLSAWRELLRRDPENTDWKRNEGLILGRLGVLSHEAHDFGSAEQYLKGALQVASELGRADPTNGQWQNDLSSAHGMLGDMMIEAGRLEEALREQNRSLEILEAQARASGREGLERNISIALERIGDCYWRMRKYDEARDAFTRCLNVRSRLQRDNPKSEKHGRDLMAIMNRICLLYDDRKKLG